MGRPLLIKEQYPLWQLGHWLALPLLPPWPKRTWLSRGRGSGGGKPVLTPTVALHAWHCHAHTPWDGFGLVNLEKRRCWNSGCLWMDLQASYLPTLPGKQDYRTESLRVGRQHLAPLVVRAHPALRATIACTRPLPSP